MAKLRAANAYRRIKRAYTRRSKYRKKGYIKGVPGNKIVMYDMGNRSRQFSASATLYAKKAVNLRHNAIESARMTSNKHMERSIGKPSYHLKIRVVPHHVMRENPLATGAGADRFQTGMSHSFGKPIGFSAQVREGNPLITVYCEPEHLEHAKEALRKASRKFPIPCRTEFKLPAPEKAKQAA